MEKLKYDLDIQYFAEDEDNTKTGEETPTDETTEDETTEDEITEETTEEEPEAPVLTFDELLTDKYYQSEFDKKMAKGLKTALSKHEEELEELREYKKQFEETKSEYERLKETANKTKAEIKAESEIEIAIVKAGARDEIAIKAHLQEITNNQELSNEEKVEKVKERLTELKKEKDYLFTGSRSTGFELGYGDTEDSLQSVVEKSMGVK